MADFERDFSQGYIPPKQLEAQYGWVWTWSYPLRSHIDGLVGITMTADLARRTSAMIFDLMMRLAVYGKFGVELPEVISRSQEPIDFQAKMLRSRTLDYSPCSVCGETRITHDCHIIPRKDGGPGREDNYVTLCPLHHHLFDHSRLTREEWGALRAVIGSKMDSAIVYADKVRFPALESFWGREQ